MADKVSKFIFPVKTGDTITNKEYDVGGSGGSVTIDDALSDTSENPVQNKVVKEAVDGKSNTNHNHDDRYYTEAEENQIINTLNGADIQKIERNGTTFTVTRNDGTTFTFTQQDNNTTYGLATTSADGLLKKLDGSTAHYMRGDGSWATPPDNNTTYSASTGLSLSGTAFSVKYGTAAGTSCQGNDSRLSNSRTPTSHASTGTGYGAGNASYYGHVKVSDNYTSSAGNASQSVAASSKAVYDCYTNIKNYWHWYGHNDGDVSHRIVYMDSCKNKTGIQVWYGRGIAIIIIDDVNMNMPTANTNYAICYGLPPKVFGQVPKVAVNVNNGGSARVWFDDTYLRISAEGGAEGADRWIKGQLVYPTTW